MMLPADHQTGSEPAELASRPQHEGMRRAVFAINPGLAGWLRVCLSTSCHTACLRGQHACRGWRALHRHLLACSHAPGGLLLVPLVPT